MKLTKSSVLPKLGDFWTISICFILFAHSWKIGYFEPQTEF